MTSPSDVPGLLTWLEADTLLLNDGDAVTTWTDLSGNNNSPTQATAAKKPTFKTNIINGKPAILFDGLNSTSGDVLRKGFARSSPETVFMVFKHLAPAANKIIIDGYENPNNSRVALTTAEMHLTAGSNVDYSAPGVDAFAIWTIEFNGASSKMYKAGSVVATGDAGTTFDAGLTIGASSYYALFGSSPTSCSNMYMASLIVYSGVLLDADRNGVGLWLKSKYGLNYLDVGDTTLTVDETITLVSGGDTDHDFHARPSCVVLNGVVTTVFVTGPSHTGGGDCHFKFSTDYGLSWTAVDKFTDGSDIVGAGMSGEPYLFDAPNGNLIIHLGRGFAPVNGGTWFCKSTDLGKTWTNAASINISGIVGNTAFLNLIDDHFIYNGVIYLSGRISTDGNESNVKSVICKSADNGATWEWVGDICLAGVANEVGIEYLGNNRIIAIMRAVEADCAYRSFSDDMGVTWSSIDNIAYQISWSGKHRIYTKTHLEGGADWWNDLNLVMGGFVFSGNLRINSLWFSTDAGITWTPARSVDTAVADAGYGDLFYRPSSRQYIYLNYYGTNTTADVRQYNITPSWNSPPIPPIISSIRKSNGTPFEIMQHQEAENILASMGVDFDSVRSNVHRRLFG